eukprot:4868838-Lingulodinium_polyedra.AAC.1
MTGPGIEPYAAHTVRCIDAPRTLARLFDAERGADDEAPPLWGPEAWRDAVAVFPHKDALPAMLAAALEAAEHMGFRVGVQGGA